MTRKVICISRSVAAGGETIGQRVAEQLGFSYVDEEIITLASRRAQLDPSLLAKAEQREPLLNRLLDALSVGTPSELLAMGAAFYMPGATPVTAPVADDLRLLIRDAIADIAARGRAVIVAHAASYALGGGPEVLRVLVTASPETRAQRLGLLDAGDAAKAVRESDKDREYYLRRFYDVRDETPLHYDLVLNTDTLSPDQAVAAIVAAAR